MFMKSEIETLCSEQEDSHWDEFVPAVIIETLFFNVVLIELSCSLYLTYDLIKEASINVTQI